MQAVSKDAPAKAPEVPQAQPDEVVGSDAWKVGPCSCVCVSSGVRVDKSFRLLGQASAKGVGDPGQVRGQTGGVPQATRGHARGPGLERYSATVRSTKATCLIHLF